MRSNKINIEYAAGKVAGAIGGTYNATSTGSGQSANASISFNADGTGEVTTSPDGGYQPFNWYTGGVPTGTTQFIASATNVVQDSVPASNFTVNQNNSLSLSVNSTEATGFTRQSSAQFSITVTRGAQSVVYDVTLGAESFA